MSNVIEMAAGRRADAAEMARFLTVMHKHAAADDDFQVCIGVYPNGGEQYWARPRFAPIDAGIDNIARGFARFATEAANAGVGDAGQTVAIRVCGLGSMRKEKRPDEPYEGDANVVFASFIAIEVDARPTASLRALRSVFGEPTMLVESGGVWTGPDGVAERKIHVYYRLDRPARTDEELARLKTVRSRACRLVDADASGVSLGHPMRLPGTWHTKGEPRLCRVVGGDPDRELSLDVAFRNVTEALEAEGLDVGGAASIARGERKGFTTQIEWHASDLRTAAAIMPNDRVGWEDWNTRGMSFWDASHASADGLEAFIEWSRKDTAGRFDEGYCEARWAHWHVSPPAFASGDTLARHVRKEEPSWSPSATLMEHWYEPLDEPAPAARARAAGNGSPAKRGGILDDDGDETDGEDEDAEPGAPSNVTPLFGDRVDDAAPLWVREMNKRHAIIEHKGEAFPITEEDDGSVSRSTPTALRTRYAPWPVEKGRVKTPKYDAWEAHVGRRFYSGWTFDPTGKVPTGHYNRWRGFPLLPNEDRVDASGKACQLILAHMRDVVCSGNEDHYRYLIRWLAHLVQHPGDKPGVAVILRGGKGSGKDTLGYYLGRIMPRFYVNTAQQRHLTGNFNSHLATCLLLHVEEMGWAGKSKMDDGLLKSLVTNPNQIEERKGFDADPGQKSFLRLLVTSNEDWIVPATQDERRYFVLDVSNVHQQDHDYFAAIAAEMDGLGPAALRKHLEAISLDDFQVRQFPKTDALMTQKVSSMTGFERFWHEVMEADDFFPGDDDRPWLEAPATVEKSVFFGTYERWSKERREPVTSASAVSAKLADYCGLPAKEMTIRPRGDAGRNRHYAFPSLATLRERWNARF